MNPRETLLKIIRSYKKIDENAVTNESNVRLDLGLDSLQLAAIAGDAEDAFDVEITDAEAAGAQTVGEWLQMIESKQKDR